MQYSLPRIVVNLKNYEQGIALNGFDLVKILDEVACEYGVEIGVAVNVVDIKDFLRLKLKMTQIWGQYVDEVGEGANTGSVNSEYLSELGMAGSLLNHSEKRIGFSKLSKTVEKLDGLGVFSLVCTEGIEEGSGLAAMWPDAIAFEPPELIGGNVSVSSAKPELIKEIVNELEIPVFVGAGIKTDKDVLKSLELGAYGVLVASGIVKAEEPGKILASFLKVITEYVER